MYIIELCAESVQAAELTSCHVKTVITCNTCLQRSVKEDPSHILQLPISDSVQNSITSFLRPEELNGSNLYFCNVCSALQPAVLEHHFSRIGTFLIVHLKRFLNLSDAVTKDTNLVNCVKDISIPVVCDDEIVQNKTMKLIATINHSGNLNSGHYTAHVSHSPSGYCFHCNDTTIVPCQKRGSGCRFSGRGG